MREETAAHVGARGAERRADASGSAWERQRFVPLHYAVSETQPIRVAPKLHENTSGELFDMHYALELGIVLSGCMERLYHRHRRVLGAGQVWLCGAWEPHGWRVMQGPCHAVVVSIFPPTLASPGFPELAGFEWQAPFLLGAAARPEVPGEARQLMQQLGQKLCESVDLPTPQRLLQQRMLVYQLLLELPRAEPSARAPLPHDSWSRINRAVELVFRERRYVSSSEAARECALSHKALNALFGRAVGVSFAKFALRYRLQGAASRLLESHDPVKAIARDWGFVDASHFHACFRASYGCSPARYRESGGAPERATKLP
jgi:AraC-like DNA-binding protein